MFGERMEKRRKELKLSRADLAEMLGVGINTVFRWEKGQRNADDEKKKKIASILKCTVAFLIGETENPLPVGKQNKGTLRVMREEARLSLKEAGEIIGLPPEDVEMMEENEDLADEGLKKKLIKTYTNYLAQSNKKDQKSVKGESEEDLETLLKMLAAEDPDLVLQFRHVAKNVDRVHPKDKEFLATMLKAALGKIELEDHTDEY